MLRGIRRIALVAPCHADMVDLRQIVLDLGEGVQHHAAVVCAGFVGGRLGRR